MSRSAPQRRSSLFRRIYGTFVLTFVVAAVLVGSGGWLLARALGNEWVSEALELLETDNDGWVAQLADPAALTTTLRRFDDRLGTRTAIYTPDGDRVAGQGPEHVPGRFMQRERRLRRGRPIVHRQGEHPIVVFPLTDAEGEIVALAHVVAAPPQLLGIGAAITLLFAAAFGLGARRLSRSLTSRIATLETSVGRIADGELAHRVAVPSRIADEIDELGGAVNHMAERLERLVAGQRTLLANVSHELRTPIARTKVLLEILQERLAQVTANGTPAPVATPAKPGSKPIIDPITRVQQGLLEMAQDIVEVESLIGDLLTGARLELRAGEGAVIDATALPLAPLLQRCAGKVHAQVDAAATLTVAGDEFLLERLFSNLLANARRACPDGTIELAAARHGDRIVVRVQDEGPGIAPEHREIVFEPFRRLDDARSRDRGGVGLGLYLCRQIAHAHDGSLVARERPDGRRGACLELELPAATG
ncbi:MAG: HAMP domain-containing protein [Deltaproteobacteria bacterium]|nr:HAMP domain-containing protein [Deltaproteobacteria bacterium]MBK8720168.1 HAMP domain-containing protein [Deltaproteobacteria bacterium]MBP7286016.1 HAMP domain-containing protein [Nannocystaceae bacterium]